MNQNNPETYALTVRCPLSDAVKLRALARTRGITPSALVAALVREAVAGAEAMPEDLAWAAVRRAGNAARRKLQDERTCRGDYRKPGWEATARFRENDH